MAFSREVPLPLDFRQRRPLPIVRVRAGKPIRVLICSSTWWGCNLHYDGEKNLVCPGEDVCKQCENGVDYRWNGFLAGSRLDGSAISLLSITPCCIGRLIDSQKDGSGLLGQEWQFWRRGQTSQTELLCKHTGESENVRVVYSKEALAIQVDRIFRPHAKRSIDVIANSTPVPRGQMS